MSSAEGMQIPEDLLQALNHCDSAVAKETGWRIAALRSMIAQEYNHDAHHKPYSALVMAHEHIARLEAQNAKLIEALEIVLFAFGKSDAQCSIIEFQAQDKARAALQQAKERQ